MYNIEKKIVYHLNIKIDTITQSPTILSSFSLILYAAHKLYRGIIQDEIHYVKICLQPEYFDT